MYTPSSCNVGSLRVLESESVFEFRSVVKKQKYYFELLTKMEIWLGASCLNVGGILTFRFKNLGTF